MNKIKLIFSPSWILISLCVYGQGQITRVQNNQASSTPTIFSVSGTVDGHDYVDLGLSSGTLWATCNLEANSPAAYGEYFAWAETNPKNTYMKENCITYNLHLYADGLSKDLKTDTVRAKIRIIGNPKFDAASASWGDCWELPSGKDFTELNKECTWELKTIDGHKGYVITGPNGNSMFLPMAGYIDRSQKSQIGSGGFYWTGDFWDDTERSTTFNFHKSSHGDLGWGYRHTGKVVRPVLRQRKSSNNQFFQ
ncbi:MAG: hypothetical protein LIP09_15815 [Bacteroidales bacterium]|nr:hypothetical protein [Bacteroidales bacterium]